VRTALLLALAGAVMFVSGVTLAVWLLWDWRAALAAALVLAGGVCVFVGNELAHPPTRPRA
jgi:hypothetical protein